MQLFISIYRDYYNEGPLLAESSPTSWICERLLTGKPTYKFRLLNSGVDPERTLQGSDVPH
jgi:hypothetical protein